MEMEYNYNIGVGSTDEILDSAFKERLIQKPHSLQVSWKEADRMIAEISSLKVATEYRRRLFELYYFFNEGEFAYGIPVGNVLTAATADIIDGERVWIFDFEVMFYRVSKRSTQKLTDIWLLLKHGFSLFEPHGFNRSIVTMLSSKGFIMHRSTGYVSPSIQMKHLI